MFIGSCAPSLFVTYREQILMKGHAGLRPTHSLAEYSDLDPEQLYDSGCGLDFLCVCV